MLPGARAFTGRCAEVPLSGGRGRCRPQCGSAGRRRPRSRCAPCDLLGDVSSSVTCRLSMRTRSLGTVRFSTTGSSACSVTSCSSSVISPPESAASRLASVIGSRSTRTSSRWTGTVCVHVLGDDVLAQPRAAGLAAGRCRRRAPPPSASSRRRSSGPRRRGRRAAVASRARSRVSAPATPRSAVLPARPESECARRRQAVVAVQPGSSSCESSPSASTFGASLTWCLLVRDADGRRPRRVRLASRDEARLASRTGRS